VKPLTLADLPSPEEFLRQREGVRRRVMEVKARRRVAVGPVATFVFENRETVRWQVLEMCRVEGHVTPEKRLEELAVDNEMLPEDGGLAATLFLELDGEALLRKWLPLLVGVEESVFFRFGGREVRAAFEPGRHKEDTTSCVHYVKFAFTDVERRLFAASEVTLGTDHARYRHLAVLSAETRDALVEDWR